MKKRRMKSIQAMENDSVTNNERIIKTTSIEWYTSLQNKLLMFLFDGLTLRQEIGMLGLGEYKHTRISWYGFFL